MAEFELRAGAKLDLFTHHEAKQVLRDWMVETTRGARPRRYAAQASISANAVTVGGSDQFGETGPEAGMVWAVLRVGVVGLTNATDATSVFVNGTHPMNTVVPALTGVTGSTGNHEFQQPEILLPNDRLIIASTGAIGATGTVTMYGLAWELPIGLLWRLLR